MLKYFAIISTFLLVSMTGLSAQEAESQRLTPEERKALEEKILQPPTAITPEQKVRFRKDYNRSINFAAENYRPEQLREIAKAANSIQKDMAERAVNKGYKNNEIEYSPDRVNINDTESVKEFMNKKLIKKFNEATEPQPAPAPNPNEVSK